MRKITKTVNHYMTEYRDENGLLHRDDGPAKIYMSGDEEWFIKGRKYDPWQDENIREKYPERLI